MFKKKVKNLRKQESTSFFHRIGRDAYLDWSLSVFFSIILAIVLIVLAYKIHIATYVLTDAGAKTNGASKLIFDENLMDKTLKVYADRAVLREKIEKAYEGVADPSH